jgi:tetratricopeptide (TPR) repeat protein
LFYLAAAEVIGRHPFFGTGPGNFPLAYPHNNIYKVKTEDPNDVLTHVHNDFLEIWAEYGLFSFLAYLGVLAVFIYEWGKAFKRAEEPRRQAALILFFCALAGYICYSLMTVAGRYMSSVFYFWLVMGIGYLYLKDTQDTEKSVLLTNPLKKNRKILWVIGVGIILIFGLACKKILANYVSDVYMNKAYRLVSQKNYNSALKCLNTAIALYPKSVEAYYQRGFVYFSKGLPDRAIEDYETVIQMAPNYVNVYLNTASCFYRKKDLANAVRTASISYRLFPDYLPNLMTLAYCYYYMGKPQTSRMYYERIPERYKDLPQVLQLRQKLEKIFNKKEEEDYGKNAEFDHSNISRNDGSCAYLPGRYSG